MTPELQQLLHQIDALKADGHAVCAGLSESQFNWRPGEGRWSIAECLVHLNVAVSRTLPAFDRAIAAGRAKGRTAKAAGAGPIRYGWFSRWMTVGFVWRAGRQLSGGEDPLLDPRQVTTGTGHG